jgi:hypothetical protein
VPTFRLRWANEHEDENTIKPTEKIFSRLREIKSVKEFKVSQVA